jgi:exodeoxyribonuclease V beta subunit
MLFMIGDPKQAIYGFRGADIFSYLRAARSAQARFTLTTNWRSAPGLVGAVNTLFSNVSHPFLFRDIGFIPGRSAQPPPSRPTPALEVWYLEALRHRPDGKALTKPQARQLIARAVTADIREKVGRGELAGRTGEIAVLVRTNQEARLMKAHFAGAGIPSVLYSTASVFDAPEAPELLAVLQAVAEPHHPGRLKSALATHLLGENAAEIAAGENLPGPWEERTRRNWSHLNLWNERGFMPMFRRLLAGEAVRERLIALPDGERRLTNLLHLGELIHRAAEMNHLGVSGILKWLTAQLRPGADRSEENQLRLESDERAVKIVTIHRSKGLEYPVVYCPFSWSAAEVEERDFFFHDPDSDFRLTVDVSGVRDTPNRRLARNEALAENLRMLYVALTRARERCILVWGRINTADTSALAYLLRAGEAAAAEEGAADWHGYLKAEFKQTGDAEWRTRLESLAAASGGTIRVCHLPEPPAAPLPELRPVAAAPSVREFGGQLDGSWGVTSYSALAARGPGAADREDPHSEEIGAAGTPEEGGGGLHAFPAGARSGLFFHALLETIDFKAPPAGEVVGRMLARFGFDPAWSDPVGALIAELAAVPLLPGEHPPRLCEIPPGRCVAEMEFYFPLNRVSPALIEKVLAPMGPPPGKEDPAEEPPALVFAPTHGFLRGFIDLVCEHNGRFYLVDWKSNRLGAGIEDYAGEGLGRAMRAHRYDLQIQLYSLALHQLLRQRVPAYDYERHFGGAIYIFLRGVSRARGPASGIFAFRPEHRRIDRLGKALIPDYE